MNPYKRCLTTWAPFFRAMVLPRWTMSPPKRIQNYFASSDPPRDIILLHICHKFRHSLC